MPLLALSRSQTLRETNHRLGFWLNRLRTSHGEPVLATPEHMAGLLSELLRAGMGLRAEPLPARGFDPELDEEIDQYRRHVEHLRDLLPSIHRQLLAERARLEAQRSRVQAAAAWARASRQTL
jgi:hypothetical protein